MEELEKIKYAKLYIDKLAQGINPIDDRPVMENEVINNVRISRCLFYVSDILRQIIDDRGIKSKAKKGDFCITKEELALFRFSDEPIPLSTIAHKLNSLVDTNVYKKLSYKDLANWLIGENILANNVDIDGTMRKVITQKGRELGLILDTRHYDQQRSYTIILYNKNAQKFIIDNLDKVIELKNKS